MRLGEALRRWGEAGEVGVGGDFKYVWKGMGTDCADRLGCRDGGAAGMLGLEG